MIMKNIVSTILIFVSLTLPLFAQESPTLPLENSDYKFFYLSPTASASEQNVIIDDVNQVRVELLSTAKVIPSIIAPNGQVINQNTISSLGGEFTGYEITEAQPSFLQTETLAKGFHYIIEFPTQGPGSYTIRLTAPEGLSGDIAAAARIVTDSEIAVRLFTLESGITVGKPIALTAAVFNGQNAVSGASVVVHVNSPTGLKTSITLIDDGAGVDSLAGDGLYSAKFTPNEVGNFDILAKITGTTANNVAFSRQSAAGFEVVPLRSRLTGTVNNFPVQNPNDSRFLDGFVVKANTNTLIAGKYGLVVYLKTANGRSIIAENTANLAVGDGNIQVNFEADKILEAGENGPFSIEKIDLVYYIEDQIITVDSLTNIGQTQGYQLSQMNRPKISLTGINNVLPIDTNNNGKYEALTFQMGVNVAYSNYYNFSGTLFDLNRNEITWNTGQTYLTAGDNLISFTVSSETILNHNTPGPYKIGNLMIWDGNSSLLADEVLSSSAYELNQFETGLKFTGQNTAVGVDTNSNGKFEFLRIQSELYSALPGEHSLQASLLDSTGNIIQTISQSQNLVAGANQLQFDFNGSNLQNAIINGPLTVGNVSVSGQGRSLNVPVLFTTQSFNSNQFETGLEFVGGYSATGIDTNSDGKFNLLRIQGNIAVGIAGSYSVGVDLKDSNGNYITSISNSFNFSSGVNTFTLNLEGNPIYSSGINGPYQISAFVSGQGRYLQNQNLFQTPAFNYTDFEMTLGFTGVNSATGIDTNANGKFETLRITTSLKMPSSSSNSQVGASLIDSNGKVIESVSGYYNLVAGINNISFNFDGIKINNNGVDGPYRIGNVSVNSYAGNIYVQNLFTTQFFTANQFEGGQINLQYVTYRLVPVTGDGDEFLEPGETAELYVTLMNPGTGGARTPSAALSSDSSAVEINNGNGTYASILPSIENESTPFLIRLKPESQLGTDIPFVLNTTYSGGQTKSFNFTVQTGKLKKLLYVKYAQNKYQVYSMNSDGSGKVNLSNSAYNDQTPTPSPDGNKIVFVRLINSTTRELWVMNNDGGGQQKLTGLNRNSFLSLKWSPDSGKIVFTNRVSNIYDLYVVNSDGTGLLQLTNNSGQEDYISWSSDGNKIAYTKNGEVHVINPDGTGDTIIHTEDYQYDIKWSPDGTRLGWINGHYDSARKYYREIYVSKLDGSEKKIVTQSADARIMSWSPDSTQIAYVNVEPVSRQRDIFSVNVSSSQSINLTNILDTDNYNFDIDDSGSVIEWSPNGKKITLAGSETIYSPVFFRRTSVFTFDLNKLNLMRLTEGEDRSAAYSPVWKPETVNIDTIAPNSLASISPASNSAGWNKGNVIVNINSTDNENGSGVKEITYGASGSQTIPGVVTAGSAANLQITSEGNALVNYFAKDNAGNTETVKNLAVKIDKTAPQTAASHTINGNQATVTLTSSDSLSGVAVTLYSVDNGGIQNYSTPFTVGGDGTHKVTYYASDFAENIEAVKTLSFTLDATAPTSSATTTGVNAAGWSKANVTVNVNSIDNTNGTGVKEISYSASGAQTISNIVVGGNSTNFQIAAEGTTIASFHAVDNAGNVETDKTLNVKIDKTAPTTSGNYSLNGQQAVISLASTDASSGIENTKYSIDGGATQTYTAPFTILGSGNHSVNYFATDRAGNIEAIKTLTFTIPVINPLVSITGPSTGSIFPVGTAVNLTGAFTNDSCGTHTASWTFDNISLAGAVNETSHNVGANYTFISAGVYLITLTVNSGCGGVGTADTVDGLTAMVVIYDPNGGFVTGGGWINSPVGAYVANPNLVGKASFGFNSKYQKGATIPTGNTEFQFRVADFNFKSTSYDWLVVAGARAQYKGTGTVNGSGNYGFMLTAVDGQINGGGGTDKFRIKIWDKDTGAVIYDNQIGETDNADPNTALGGGSIVIHKQ